MLNTCSVTNSKFCGTKSIKNTPPKTEYIVPYVDAGNGLNLAIFAWILLLEEKWADVQDVEPKYAAYVTVNGIVAKSVPMTKI